MRPREAGAFQDILAAIAADAIELTRMQFVLLRAEAGAAVRSIIIAIVLAVIGLAAAATATVFLGMALFEWFVTVMASKALAALSVAGVATVVAVCILALAYWQYSRTSFLPRRTLAALRRNAEDLFDGEIDE